MGSEEIDETPTGVLASGGDWGRLGSAITSSLMAPHRARECASVRSAAAADKLLTVDHTSAFRSVFVTHRRAAIARSGVGGLVAA